VKVYAGERMKVKKAVIPAAGLGTRFLPATKAQPKEMLPIINIPVIQYVVQEAIDSGIDDILIITGKNKRAIEDHFDANHELERIGPVALHLPAQPGRPFHRPEIVPSGSPHCHLIVNLPSFFPRFSM